MEIVFQTKEESNKKQQEDFLKLPKWKRFFVFVELSKQINQFPTKHKKEKNRIIL